MSYTLVFDVVDDVVRVFDVFRLDPCCLWKQKMKNENPSPF
jgi:hypothetical protein